MKNLAYLMIVCVGSLAFIPVARGEMSAEWVGQDGKDFVGPSANVAPSGTQDLHIRLHGLPADKPVTHIRVTRLGGGEWQYKGPWGPFAIVMDRKDKSTDADLYLEPTYDENSAQWDINVTYADGSTAHTTLKTGKSDTKLRMPDATLSAEWAGQDGRDWTGRYAAVGPDGIQDVVLKLKGLSNKLGVLKAIRVEAEDGPTWEYGVNPDHVWNAEVFMPSPDSPTAEMLISPPLKDISGKKLKLTVWYGHNRDHMFTGTGVAGKSDPNLKTPRPKTYDVEALPKLSAKWLGQDGTDVTGRGDIHVRLDGLPDGATIRAATLSDNGGGSWVWRADDKVEYYAPPGGEEVDPARVLAFRVDPHNKSAADLFFPPFRDEKGARMTFRVLLADGTMRYGQFEAQQCDPFLRGPLPSDKTITAKPGDDLAKLVDEYGTIKLSAGTYTVNHPIELKHPVTITGPREAIVQFKQPAGDEPWHGVFYISADNVTLEGFTLRFDGPVRWATDDWRLGCALIRTHERADRTGDLVNLTVRDMDIESSAIPPLADKSKPVDVPNILRAGRVLSGRIIGNTFRGGTIDVVHGPWTITDNLHLGPPAGGIGFDAFAAHYVHDLKVERNKLHADPAGGKLWRFLVLTQYASHSIIRDNEATGVGMRYNDPMPNPNAPEMFLTESYRLHYEGRPVYRSPDGMVVQIPVVMWGEVRPGTVLAILDGEHAGQWIRVAQAIDPVTFLLDRPLPTGDFAISLSTGMVDELYENNLLDGRGGPSSMMQLCSTSFNTVVRNNRIKGGNGVLIQGVPTEVPGVWGWSHCPLFDFVFEGNTIEDSRHGLTVETNHSKIHTKSVAGRLYATTSLIGNTIRWTTAFADHLAKNPPKQALHAMTLGSKDAPSADDLRVTLKGNRVEAPASMKDVATAIVHNATVNGKAMSETVIPLPMAALEEKK